VSKSRDESPATLAFAREPAINPNKPAAAVEKRKESEGGSVCKGSHYGNREGSLVRRHGQGDIDVRE